MRNLFLLLSIFGLFISCGSSEQHHINVRYIVKDTGITHIIIPSKFSTSRINGIIVKGLYYSEFDDRILTHVITTNNIELELNSCPVMDGYDMSELKCRYTLIK